MAKAKSSKSFYAPRARFCGIVESRVDSVFFAYDSAQIVESNADSANAKIFYKCEIAYQRHKLAESKGAISKPNLYRHIKLPRIAFVQFRLHLRLVVGVRIFVRKPRAFGLHHNFDSL